jgi:superfamily I DNA/RNA helicase
MIGSRQYLRQIEEYLTKSGRIIESRQDHKTALFFERGLELLKENPESNLGWRIILQTGKRGLAISVVAQADSKRALHELIPDELKKNVLAEAEKFTPANTGAGDSQEEATKLDGITIKLTSFEGAKGMSAQHIFLVGLHAGELPKDAKDIQDLEICKFLVGLTRTKKRCSILWTRCFGQESKQPSVFIDWIQTERYELLSVDAKYWKRRHTPSGKGSSLFQKFVAATQKRRHRF